MNGARSPLVIGAVDDHPVILTGLAEGLRPYLPTGSRIAPVARTVTDLVEAALGLVGGLPGALAGESAPTARHTMDVVLLDLELHDGSDPATNVRTLLDLGWPVVIYTQDPRHHLVARAFRAGAAGLLSKGEELEVIAEALRLVASGGSYLSPQWASAIADDLERVAPSLTPREVAAVQLYAGGMKLTSVARRLGVGADTARTYLNRARHKYADVGRPAPTKTALYERAIEDGLLDPPG